MDFTVVLIFLFIFFTLGGGGYIFWKQFKPYQLRLKREIPSVAGPPIDATLGSWTPKTTCQAFSGACGRGEIIMERKCLNEGQNGGQMCADFGVTERKDECYVDCPRPVDIVDWGYPNDDKGNPATPRKGWYDFSGQGQPNDYCRWVGESNNRFWACHTQKSPYVKADSNHITFSAGPSNNMKPFKSDEINKLCPKDASIFLTATDPDLQRSIANGFVANCSSRCVYDHRDPNTGWAFDGNTWIRVENMQAHQCGQTAPQEYKKAIENYNRVYDVKHAWKGEE